MTRKKTRRTPTIAASPPQIKPADLRTFHTRLNRWYATHGRHHLPWRTTNDPYHIWLSEVMLQQTQVQTVLERFYHPFLQAFPTVADLAAAPREQVMKAWEGLGYYRRAGFLHEAAKKAVDEGMLQPTRSAVARAAARGGIANGSERKGVACPPSIEQLRSLPGIGRNTAHAIAAFAYRQPVAILEANVKRIVARIFALKHPKEEQLWQGAETLLNCATPFEYNQAMMDLGSMICTPKNPDCPACPANTICKGQANPHAYPAPKAKRQAPTREYTILVLEDASGRLHLEQRSEALLGGLYGFPQVPRTTNLRYAMREMHIRPEDWQPLGGVTHIYSHFRLEGAVVHGKLRRRMNSPGWFNREEIAALPLSGVDHKVLALVDHRHTAKKKRTK